jgi:tripartite-type tricarboxylate transporter receptor subunit TctC
MKSGAPAPSPPARYLAIRRVAFACAVWLRLARHQSIEAGRLKASAVLSRARLPNLPNVATAQEQGMKEFEASNWMALFLPSATPEPIVARLNAAAITALADPALQAKLRTLGAEPAAPERNTPERLAVFLAAEREKWGAVIRKAQIRLE